MSLACFCLSIDGKGPRIVSAMGNKDGKIKNQYVPVSVKDSTHSTCNSEITVPGIYSKFRRGIYLGMRVEMVKPSVALIADCNVKPWISLHDRPCSHTTKQWITYVSSSRDNTQQLHVPSPSPSSTQSTCCTRACLFPGLTSIIFFHARSQICQSSLTASVAYDATGFRRPTLLASLGAR